MLSFRPGFYFFQSAAEDKLADLKGRSPVELRRRPVVQRRAQTRDPAQLQVGDVEASDLKTFLEGLDLRSLKHENDGLGQV